MSGTRGSGVLSSTSDVRELSVVRGVGGVCDMCICLARGGVDERIGFGLYHFCEDRGSVGHVPVGCGGVGGVVGECVGGFDQGRER